MHRSVSGKRISNVLLSLLVLLLAAAPLAAAVAPDGSSAAHEKEFRHPSLTIPNVYQPQQPDGFTAASDGQVDVRSDRWGTLILAEPLVPGTGNELQWATFGLAAPAEAPALAQAVREAFDAYLVANASLLRLDLAEVAPAKLVVHDDGNLVQIHVPRVVDGVPVRDSYLSAVVNHGNLVLLGSRNWGDIDVATEPAITAPVALATLDTHLAGLRHDSAAGKAPELILVPTARGTDLARITAGDGYSYRLAWKFHPVVAGERGFEALVDAHSGELLAFTDTRHYATARFVQGGVLPKSNDGVFPDGIEQAGWAMPFTNVLNAGQTLFTDSGGNLLGCVDGTITTNLNGPFLRMVDSCGAINVSTSADVLDLGTSAGTNCSVPPGTSPGNTRASRSGFYEINRIKEMARSQLPGNDWLREKLTANMNIPQTCNAFWSPSLGTVNFYRSGGGCSNTGEIAGIFDHEWGHGMDNNDLVPAVSNPGEGIADIYAALRLADSCIGRNFRPGINCGGYGDPCTSCTGVRDIDFAKRLSGNPHGIAFIDAACGGTTGPAPCGGSVHCEGAVYAEAGWDLFNRDLQGAPYNLDFNTSLEIATYLTYRGAGAVGTWYNCAPGTGTGNGCNADGGYLNFLAADDDNGNLADGTPHMTAIFNAFNRHGIACPTPTVQDSGCAGTPTSAPSVTATPLDRGVSLSWGAVANATTYRIYRTDGVFACDYGKTLVGETSDLSFVDSGLQNGGDYAYVVIGVGPGDSCFGPASSCVTVNPVAGPHLHVDPASADLVLASGDGDAFLDNCEEAQLDFDVLNLGTAAQNNVRIVDVVPLTHPAITITSTFPVAVATNLAACASAPGSFTFTADGLSFEDEVLFRVEVTSDELSPQVMTQTLRLLTSEIDLQSFATKTYTFESDLENWQVASGTFLRSSTGGGASGTTFYVASSTNLPSQCDKIRSPILSLSPTSTLSLWNQFNIEAFSGGQWWDRANVSLLDVASGARTVVNPSSGRLYNATGQGGNCNTTTQPGWAGVGAAWTQSGWTAAALGAPAAAGKLTRLAINYGTDPEAQGFGFRFDQVTVTDASELVADTQSDACPVCGNGIIDAGEVCDGTNLGGQTCVDHGFDGGVLACSHTCTAFDTSGCVICEQGSTAGTWQLPLGGHQGSLAGRILDAHGNSIASFKATLTATSATTGRINGTISDGVAPDPDYEVRGVYTITSPPGIGTWSAAIFLPGTNIQVGKMGGHFDANPWGPAIGAFRGEWKICE